MCHCLCRLSIGAWALCLLHDASVVLSQPLSIRSRNQVRYAPILTALHHASLAPILHPPLHHPYGPDSTIVSNVMKFVCPLQMVPVCCSVLVVDVHHCTLDCGSKITAKRVGVVLSRVYAYESQVLIISNNSCKAWSVSLKSVKYDMGKICVFSEGPTFSSGIPHVLQCSVRAYIMAEACGRLVACICGSIVTVVVECCESANTDW